MNVMSKSRKKHGFADKATLKLDAFDTIRVEYALRDALEKERKYVYLTGVSTYEVEMLEQLLSYIVDVSKYWK